MTLLTRRIAPFLLTFPPRIVRILLVLAQESLPASCFMYTTSMVLSPNGIRTSLSLSELLLLNQLFGENHAGNLLNRWLSFLPHCSVSSSIPYSSPLVAKWSDVWRPINLFSPLTRPRHVVHFNVTRPQRAGRTSFSAYSLIQNCLSCFRTVFRFQSSSPLVAKWTVTGPSFNLFSPLSRCSFHVPRDSFVLELPFSLFPYYWFRTVFPFLAARE